MASNYQGRHILITSDLYALPLAGLLENSIFPEAQTCCCPEQTENQVPGNFHARKIGFITGWLSAYNNSRYKNHEYLHI